MVSRAKRPHGRACYDAGMNELEVRNEHNARCRELERVARMSAGVGETCQAHVEMWRFVRWWFTGLSL